MLLLLFAGALATFPDVVLVVDGLGAQTVAGTSADTRAECFPPDAARLLRFTVRLLNNGSVPVDVGEPDPASWQYSMSHGHWHLPGFARYSVVHAANDTVVAGTQETVTGLCLRDNTCLNEAGASDDALTVFTCHDQGLGPRCWRNVTSDRTCQWVDITELPAAGAYRLRIEVNPAEPDRPFFEESYGNNVAYVAFDAAALPEYQDPAAAAWLLPVMIALLLCMCCSLLACFCFCGGRRGTTSQYQSIPFRGDTEEM